MKREIERTVANAMTVEDLIAELKQMPPEARVLFACDYGDYSHTQQALPVENAEELDAGSLVKSAYSQSRVALVDDNEEKGYYCPTCDEEYTIPQCPKCHGRCVNEDGTLALDEDDEDRVTVVILR